MEPAQPIQPTQPKRRSKSTSGCCSECGQASVKAPRKERKPHPLKGTDAMKERMTALRALKKSPDNVVAKDIIKTTS